MINMQNLFPLRSCFSTTGSTDRLLATTDDFPANPLGMPTKHHQSLVVLLYRANIAGKSRLITITWCRNLLARGLCISVSDDGDGDDRIKPGNCSCKVEIRPLRFWHRQGTKRFHVDRNKPVDIIWDLRNAKFWDERNYSSPEPLSDYYVAVVVDDEIVLLLGDLKEEAYRKTCSPRAFIDPMLISKNENVLGKKRFVTRTKFHEKGRHHEVSIECSTASPSANEDCEMVIKIDGATAIHVKHLQWKFRGNESVSMSKVRVEVYWDVHGWLFSTAPVGLRHALFIFKPATKAAPQLPLRPSSLTSSSSKRSSDFCLFLHAWKIE